MKIPFTYTKDLLGNTTQKRISPEEKKRQGGAGELVA